MALRNIVKIDEEKCNGCGQCVTACAEGAIQIVDGKAKLISEIYKAARQQTTPATAVPSQLGQWPVQLKLVSPHAPYMTETVGV